jgi:hypothetical membrane protein
MSVKGIWDRAPLKLAGVLLFTASAGILMGIITAEALYPAAYSTFENAISDLGGTRPPDSVVLQPSAAIFDVTMLVAGAMIMVAAWLVHRAFLMGSRTTEARKQAQQASASAAAAGGNGKVPVGTAGGRP